MKPNVFNQLGCSDFPVILAPLAGVSDHPFRLVCQSQGADLSYVEMISATALLHQSTRTLQMLERHPSEPRLGVQVTGRTAEELAAAVAVLSDMNFDTIDINMGCPVKKVVNQGCGSSILKDVKNVHKYVTLARNATNKPLSVKVRLGWDRQSMNILEIAKAVEGGGADWITIHGRCRSDDYQTPVDIGAINLAAQTLKIRVIGNGNLFCKSDFQTMIAENHIAGVMISRGALGNPWVFKSLKQGKDYEPSLDEWFDLVSKHVELQKSAYNKNEFTAKVGAICMRKHLLWYTKGWDGGKKIRERMNHVDSLDEVLELLSELYDSLKGVQEHRRPMNVDGSEDRFGWDPKWQMDRNLDRGVGDDLLN